MKFELNNLPRNCSNDDVIAEIKRVDLLVGKDKLAQSDYKKYAKMSVSGIKFRFGSWEKALVAAGLGHKYFGTKITSKMQMQKAQYLTDKEIIDELKRVGNFVDEQIITQADFNRNSEISSGVFVRRFGSWQNALHKAGLGHRYCGQIITEKMRKKRGQFLTDEDVLKELQRIAKLLNKNTVGIEDIRSHSDIMSEWTVRRRFGSWTKAMKKAGLEISEWHKPAYSDEEYFENLLNVWTQYGRQPLYGEMSVAPSKIKAFTYARRFGNWRKALEAFVFRMNQDEKDVGQISKEEVRVTHRKIMKPVEIVELRLPILFESKREIGLGLRYKVLSRDKFKCVRCGTSPATNHSCRLHIDHIIPFSKNGRTILENLQSLCEKCNLGKGNRHLE
jgi:hypothetical protein